jgi:hypothetical protein
MRVALGGVSETKRNDIIASGGIVMKTRLILKSGPEYQSGNDLCELEGSDGQNPPSKLCTGHDFSHRYDHLETFNSIWTANGDHPFCLPDKMQPYYLFSHSPC